MPRDVSLSESKCWNGGQKLVAKTQRWAKMGINICVYSSNVIFLHRTAQEAESSVSRMSKPVW